MNPDAAALTRLLASEGFIAAEEEALALRTRSGGDPVLLDALVQRRLTGEPLAWITGTVTFCAMAIRVEPGVYVPRWLSEPLALRAVARLPEGGTAIDVCTGSGAIARVMSTRRPRARIVASDIDDRAVACASANGVDVYHGDLLDPIPTSLEGAVDVVVAVVPYVPTPELPLLQRDTFTFESSLAYDGGNDGTDILRRLMRDSRRFLRPGGALLVELGGDQADLTRGEFTQLGYAELRVLADEDGDVRGVEATFSAP